MRPDAVAVMNDEKAQASLERYFACVQNERPAKFMIAKKIPAEFSEEDPTEKLWQKHTLLTQKYYEIERNIDTNHRSLLDIPQAERSYLDLKIEIASRILRSCHFCARRCKIDRAKGKTGYCRCGSEMVVSSIFEHLGEEPELVPSGTIFTMGCTIRCRHCQNWTISQWVEEGKTLRPEELAEEIQKLRNHGCRNANLVGGEPTPWLLSWLETFRQVDVSIPVIWNSNSYYSPETARLLAGFIDVYLLDFKYGSDKCAYRISDASNYWAVCTYNHIEARKYGELIVRMLVLPEHLECCTKPTTGWIAKNLGGKTRVNLMFQYRPAWQADEIPELRRTLDTREVERAKQLARLANLTNLTT